MGNVVGQFFAFVTLTAVLIVVIAIINKPAALEDVLSGFNGILNTLSSSVQAGLGQQQQSGGTRYK